MLMGLLDIFKRKGSVGATSELKTTWSSHGVVVEFAQPLADASAEGLLTATRGVTAEDTLLVAYLAQLLVEGRCQLSDRSALIPWADVFCLQSSAEHASTLGLLGLPPQSPLRPVLDCMGALSDSDFELSVAGWTDGGQVVQPERFVGAVVAINGNEQLLAAAAWETLVAVNEFAERGASDRVQHQHELAWGRIRAKADSANALYANPYLETTLVLTPESLRLMRSHEQTPFGRVWLVSPTFDGAPDGWLNAFDGYNAVQPHYDLTRGGGRVRVVVSEPVQKVLGIIKREMPGRRIAGAKAERFMHNPFAFMGDDAHEVLREDEFERDRDDGEAVAAVFSLSCKSDSGRVLGAELIVTEHFGDGSARSKRQDFDSVDRLDEFLRSLRGALEQEQARFAWDEFDLNLEAESVVQMERGLQVAHLWRHQSADIIGFGDIYELDGYSGRIEGIGAARPIYVPVFQKKDKEGDTGWLPSDLIPMVHVTLPGHDGYVIIPLAKEWVEAFEAKVTEAETSCAASVEDAELPTPIPTAQARTLTDSFKRMLRAQDQVKGEGGGRPSEKKPSPETLLIKTNFHSIDYLEQARAMLNMPEGIEPQLPRCIRPSIELKKHQRYGVAWFQNLVSKAPTACRGALLADDMGLGKTLQLLTLLARHYELWPTSAPSLILAPKSLLDNWANEARKFFDPSFPEILVLFEDELKARKQPRSLIDEQLRERGIVDLLRPNWVGSAKVVISTYEVLTSYEFSLAKQAFAFVIADEAQRIKTPGAMVTLAAKKLKADFRIACTGTPVENSLADLWCLFDLVQPGLLGSLEEFGKTYRRPIECDTEDQVKTLQRLQKLIAPQTLRRTKADIAGDLPKKLFGYKKADLVAVQFKEKLSAEEVLEISLSEHQGILYKGGLKKLQDAAQEANGRKRARLSFGALHLMKAVCAEPYCLPGTKFLPDRSGRETHLLNSPKMAWLLERLREIRAKGEKAIVFTELREVQLALFYFLKETFGLKPFIINGDSAGRQSYIDKFSEKPCFDVIILSTLAAGAGLNVTAANHVFHFTRAWNPSKEAQATDRAYRIGQSRDVHVYCPTMVADFMTFEVRLDQLLKQKASLADATLDDGGLAAMLNGTGGDASFIDLVGTGADGQPVPSCTLTMDNVDRMDGDGFEALCALLWAKQGFQAFITPKRGGDGGIDIVALQGKTGELIQCKSSRSADLGWDAIKDVVAGTARYQARFAGTRLRRVAVTNQSFTSGAVQQAEANHVQLVQRADIELLLSAYPISNLEFDQALFDSTDSDGQIKVRGKPQMEPDDCVIPWRADTAAEDMVDALFDQIGEERARALVRRFFADSIGVPSDFNFESDDLTKVIRPLNIPFRRLVAQKLDEHSFEISYADGVPLAAHGYTTTCRYVADTNGKRWEIDPPNLVLVS
jgi:HJR/Mrr/RecB family endonuclease